MGGEGHMMDMNKRLQQNLSNRPSKQKDSKFSDRSDSYFDEQLVFAKFSDELIQQEITKIREEAQLQKKKNLFISIGLILFVILLLITLNGYLFN